MVRRNFAFFAGDAIPSASLTSIDELNGLGERSPDSEFMRKFWERVNNIILGGDAIRGEGEKYLPKLPAESVEDYAFRLKTSKFTNVYRDIVEGLAARPFENPITLKQENLPLEIEEFIKNVDGAGNNLTIFAHDVFFNGVNNGIDWINVDYTNTIVIGDNPTKADEKNLGARPFFSRIAANNVLEVRFKVVAGSEKIEFMRIREQKDGEEFIRIYQDNNVKVWWELYKEIEQQTKHDVKFVFVEAGFITIDVIPMVPFVTGRRIGRAYRYHMPLSDAAELQIELYQQESALKVLKTIGGFGILAGQGVEPDKNADGTPKNGHVGPKSILYAPPVTKGTSIIAGKWEWLVPDASIFTFLGSDVKETISQLRELGKQPLTAQSGNVTVISSSVAAKKGNSAVQIWAFALKNSLENALALVAKWNAISDYQPVVDVFTDFGAGDSAIETATTLLDMRKNGDLSQETFWSECVRVGVLTDDFNPEAERVRLLEEIPGTEFPNKNF